MRKFWRSFFLNQRFFAGLAMLVILMVLGQYYQPVFIFTQLLFALFSTLIVIDLILLYHKGSKNKISGKRQLPERFSNGDINNVHISLSNNLGYKIRVKVIDELPTQFQKRDFLEVFNLKAFEQRSFSYNVRPVYRGEYHFGALNIIINTPLSLFSRRYISDINAMVKVYPSYIEMRKFELLAISNRLTEVGIKKIRKIGHQMEFDQIRDYITGDDYRTINWKATARKGHLMVNQYQDEKSQQVFNLIDMGRNMQMPFNGMSLLDYAINTSLVLSNISMLKHDKAGLISFSNTIHSMIPAARNGRHMQSIMEILYNQQTNFKEQNLELLYAQIRRKITHRSLLILYTNFESLSSAHRQIPYLQAIAKTHLLVVVFFKNTEVSKVTQKRANTVEDIYIKTIAEKFIYDKKLIAKELNRHGIQTILTTPEELTINTLNKYLEIKSRGIL